MGGHFTLPFFAPPNLLPDSLPTPEAISSSQHVLQEYHGRRVVRVGPHFVVKYGAGVSLIEGENMLFVKQVSKIPVPDVYALYSSQEDGKKPPTNYIVMENVAGESLASCWTSLDATAKSAISEQLRTHFTQMRGISPPGYFGLLGKRPFEDSVFWTSDGTDAHISGPFDSEQQMLDALVQKHQHTNPLYRKHEFYSRLLPLVIRNHGPVFTHGDFQRKNVLVKSDGTIALVDWEAAGWYPPFWEYAMTLFSCRWDDGWHSWVVKILDEYPNEYTWMNMLFRELWS